MKYSGRSQLSSICSRCGGGQLKLLCVKTLPDSPFWFLSGRKPGPQDRMAHGPYVPGFGGSGRFQPAAQVGVVPVPVYYLSGLLRGGSFVRHRHELPLRGCRPMKPTVPLSCRSCPGLWSRKPGSGCGLTAAGTGLVGKVVLRGDYQAGVLVQPVHYARPQNPAYAGKAVPAVVHQGVYQCAFIVARRRVYHHALGLATIRSSSS